MSKLSPQTNCVFTEASKEALGRGHPRWGSDHILLAVARSDGRAAEVLAELGVEEARVQALLDRYRSSEATDLESVGAELEVGYVVTSARWLAAHLGSGVVEPEHVLLAALWHEQPASKVFRNLGVSFEAAYHQMTGHAPAEQITPKRPVYISPPGDVAALVGALQQELQPAGVSVSFAFDDEFVWFDPTPETFELEPYVSRALARVRR